VTSSGTLTLDAGSTLNVGGSVTFTSGSTLDEQVGGTPASGLYGQAVIGGSAVLAGSFSLALINGFTPAAGQDYSVLKYASASGSFPAISGLPSGMVASQGGTAFALDTTVTWINPNSGNWDVAANWSSGAVPSSGQYVVINTASAATITIQSGDSELVSSLETSANDTLSITGGSLTVTVGTSTLSGPLAMTGGSLVANGSGASFTVSGTTTVATANLYAEGGAMLSLPGLTSYTSTVNFVNTTLEATGAGSQLLLSALTSLAYTANDGGQIQVTTSSGGDVELPMLTQMSGPVLLSSSSGSGTIDVAKLNTFTGGTISDSGGTLSLPMLANATSTTFEIGGGTVMTLTTVTQANNANSRSAAERRSAFPT